MKTTLIIRHLTFIFCFSAITSISAQELSEYPGFLQMKYYQDDVELKKHEFQALLKEDKASFRAWSKSKSFFGAGTLAIVAEGVFLVRLNRKMVRREKTTFSVLGVTGSTILAIVFYNISNKLKREAIIGYNARLEEKVGFQFGPTGNGVGLTMSFN